MPELPEVETIRRGLLKVIVGKKIVKFESRDAKVIQFAEKDIEGLYISDIERRAKILVFYLTRDVIPAKAGIQKNTILDPRVKPEDDSASFPCVELVRYKNVDFSDRSAEYFGPYPSGELLKKSLHYLRKIFPYRDCSKTKFVTYEKKGRPCIYGDIRVCTGPCALWVNASQYNKNILYLKNFLRGKKAEIYKKLNSEMNQLSRGKRFEEAALIRDRLNALDHLKDVSVGIRDDVFVSGNLLFKRVECYDISDISGAFAVGSMVVFENGKKNTDEYRKFKIKQVDSPNDLTMMQEILERRFKNSWPLPDLIVIDGGETHLKVAEKVLKEYKLNIPVVSIAKGPARKKNEFHFSDSSVAIYFHGNIQLQNIAISARDESHRFAIKYYRELHKKGMFK